MKWRSSWLDWEPARIMEGTLKTEVPKVPKSHSAPSELNSGTFGTPTPGQTPIIANPARDAYEFSFDPSGRPQMPAGIRLLQYEPKTPPVRLSICETVTDPEIFTRATLGQLDACLKGRTWQAGNWGLEGLLRRLAGVGCVVKVEREG